jgi:hypothetical protein
VSVTRREFLKIAGVSIVIPSMLSIGTKGSELANPYGIAVAVFRDRNGEAFGWDYVCEAPDVIVKKLFLVEWWKKRTHIEFRSGQSCERCGAGLRNYIGDDWLNLFVVYDKAYKTDRPWDLPDDCFTVVCKQCRNSNDICPRSADEEVRFNRRKGSGWSQGVRAYDYQCDRLVTGCGGLLLDGDIPVRDDLCHGESRIQRLGMLPLVLQGCQRKVSK